MLDRFDADQPVVGMVHLPALPGAPGHDSPRDAIREDARRDARALAEGGVDGVLVENFGDAPFYPDDVPKHVVAEMTRAVTAVRDAVSLPVGVNVLRNDAPAAVAVAGATGAGFVRVNVHTGAKVTDQGLVEGRAHETLRLRERIDATVSIVADVGVKHAAALGDGDVAGETRDAVERGGVDAVVVSGAATGATTNLAELRSVRAVLDAREESVPLFVGSGVTPSNVGEYLSVADGVVVGTALKEGGVTTNPVDPERVADFVDAADAVR